jgi:GNAT superfamily N-acetyltransferase
MRLIRYRPEFLEAMLTLHRSALEGLIIGLSQEREEADLVAIEHFYLRGGGEFLLGFEDDRLVAMGGLKRLAPDSGELRRMRIAPDRQGHGLGSVLLRELEQKALEAGMIELRLETALARPHTLAFYRKHGYQETGRSYYGAVETVQFRKTLGAQNDGSFLSNED